MLKNIADLGKTLHIKTQKSILGGNSCSDCYFNCQLTSNNRVELGICFDNCQQFYC